ncbi:MAG TPA: PspC domain-containing protein [Cyclobacteriaceae bacterium]|nr:PspC domain-containing protein [Cyclobacteriaceae bacterium]
MKKNISINISGIIFHIEEDGYDRLKKYLDSIHKYFSTFEDSNEILADIESRIAELFLSKLNEGKQVITADDVNALIATMGSVSDFRAAEAEEAPGESETSSAADDTASGEQRSRYSEPKRLVRDEKRKILGGVCAGIAHYVDVDPVWIRLLFALTTAFYGITFIVYVVLWVAMPGSFDIEEPADNKKMFRDPETKALGGVSGGVAAYFGIDITIVRILFIVFTFAGGIGLLTYIVLWVILPEAHTITDRMQMQGEPVTLSNIESNIKKGLNIQDGENESTLTKILLFPFRLIALILTGIARMLGPLAEVVRVAIGIIAVLIGVGYILSVVVTTGVLLGMLSFPEYWDLMRGPLAEFPIDGLREIVPLWLGITACLVALLPGILMTLLGISIVASRNVITPGVGWSLFILFFAGLGLLAYGGSRIAIKFHESGTYRTERTFALDGRTAVFRLADDADRHDSRVEISLRGYEGEHIMMEEAYRARGGTRSKAVENAKMVTYTVTQQDSILTFDPQIRFAENAVFRNQKLDITLNIPFDHPFVMDEEFAMFIRNYVHYGDADRHTWVMTRDGLECRDCESSNTSVINTDLSDFNAIDLSGAFDATIRQGDRYAIDLSGPDGERAKYEVYKSGNTLVIEYENRRNFDFKLKKLDVDPVHITITLPNLQSVEAVGYGRLRLDEITTDDLHIDLKGPIRARAVLTANDVIVSLTGSAEADLSGTAQSLDAEVTFASRLDADNLEVVEADIEASGASTAEVNVTGSLKIEEGIGSSVEYRGNPGTVIVDR